MLGLTLGLTTVHNLIMHMYTETHSQESNDAERSIRVLLHYGTILSLPSRAHLKLALLSGPVPAKDMRARGSLMIMPDHTPLPMQGLECTSSDPLSVAVIVPCSVRIFPRSLWELDPFQSNSLIERGKTRNPHPTHSWFWNHNQWAPRGLAERRKQQFWVDLCI